MECIIPGNNMKVFGKTLQALSKIGDELYVEAKKDRLCLITLNTSKTVCAKFHFLDSFFSCYEVNEDDLKAANNETITCKVHMKVFLPLFKGNLEKKLDYFKLEYATDSDFIIFKMKYRCDDIVMVHKLRLMDNETLSIRVDTNSGPNNVGASSTFYNQLLAMFNVSDDEITFDITPEKVIARNYCIGTPTRPKMMRSQINLNSTEFLVYSIAKDTTINFSLKPFRTVIQFAETFNLNIDFNFEIGGKPLSIIMRNPTFEVNFIVATLNPNSDVNSSISSSENSVATKVQQESTKRINTNDVLGIEPETWDSNDVSNGSGSTFAKLMKQAKNDTENNGDVVPRSPESPHTKKAKTVFGRGYDPTFHETVLGEVLAENSDTD